MDNNNVDIEITEPVMLININKKYKDNMTDNELYEATRECWKVSKDRADNVKFAISNYRGKVLEVYEIYNWEYCNSHNRYFFNGKIASKEIRNKYLDGTVAGYRKKGAQNPILYINC